jgi:NTE family protein
VAWTERRKAFEDRLRRSVGWFDTTSHVEAPSPADDLAVVLDGGGARAAYQVGLLRGLVRRHPNLRIPMITGVSAGAINASFLAAHPGPLRVAVDELGRLWSGLTVEQVFRVDMWSLASNAFHWGLGLVSGGRLVRPPLRGMVDTAPLRKTLEDYFGCRGEQPITGIARNLESDRLDAIAIVTSSYTTGRTVAWVQGRNVEDWERPFRLSRRCTLTVDHVMASAALPLFFPAVQLGEEWFGDGGIRLITPFSPAVHLGARRILAFSTRYGRAAQQNRPQVLGYPPPAQIAGQLLNAVFLDDLDRDAQTLVRLNLLLEDLPEERRRGLRIIDMVLVRPSQDIGRLADRYEPGLPGPLRHMLGGTGTRQTSSSTLLSLLMFDPDYIKRLLEIGEADFEARAADVDSLLSRSEMP